jgi:hypothetical protein
VFVEDVFVPIPPQQLKNYFKSISEQKDIAKLAGVLNTSIHNYKSEINAALVQMSKFQFLWEKNREDSVKVSVFLFFDKVVS